MLTNEINYYNIYLKQYLLYSVQTIKVLDF